jgi:uncharacterized protein DUF4124
MRAGAAMILVSCLFPLGGSAQGLFKCTLKSGRTVYQDSKCDEDSRQSVLKGPPPPASVPCPTSLAENPRMDPKTGLVTPQSPAAEGELEAMVDILVNYEGCSVNVPGFSSRFQGAYRQWHERSREAFARYEAHPAARRMVECRLEAERDREAKDTAQGKDYQAKMCMEMIGPAVERIAREGMPQRPQ